MLAKKGNSPDSIRDNLSDLPLIKPSRVANDPSVLMQCVAGFWTNSFFCRSQALGPYFHLLSCLQLAQCSINWRQQQRRPILVTSSASAWQVWDSLRFSETLHCLLNILNFNAWLLPDQPPPSLAVWPSNTAHCPLSLMPPQSRTGSKHYPRSPPTVRLIHVEHS